MPSLALIGGRGYTGSEFLKLLARHDHFDLVLASSSSQSEQLISDQVPDWPDKGQTFIQLGPSEVDGVKADVWVLALPNGKSSVWVSAIEKSNPEAVILDLGADWRFDSSWVYGLTEWNRPDLANARRIANPGCYATGAQFGLLPFRDWLTRPPVIFGVSGFSGAGKTPSDRNNPERLRENLLPYALCGHVHESEISTRLGRPVRFHPHVASFFRGISLTIAMDLADPMSSSKLIEQCANKYVDEPLIQVTPEIPEVQSVACSAALHIGGFTVDERNPHRASFVVTLDNLLKGAASQALQNLNLACGLDELMGIRA